MGNWFDKTFFKFDPDAVEVAKSIAPVVQPMHQTYLALPNANVAKLFESTGSLLTKPNTEGLRWESKTYTHLYHHSPWVSTIIDLISAAASKKFHIARRDGKPNTPEDEKVILSFLDAPNEFDTFLSFYRKIIKSVLLYGSCCIEFHVSSFDKSKFKQDVNKALPPSLDNGFGDMANQIMEDTLADVVEVGFPVYAAVLPFDQMAIHAEPNGTITGYTQYSVNGYTIPFSKQEIIQIHHPTADNLVYGDSPLEGILEILSIDMVKDKRQLKIIKNETIINKFMSLPAGTPQEELNKHQRAIDMYYQQHGSTSDTFVMTDDMKIDLINEGQKEGDFLKLSMQIRDRVCAKYGVPIGIIDSEGTSSTHSQGVDSLYRGFIQNSVRPVAEHVATMLNRKMFPHFGNVLGTEYVLIIDLLDDDDQADLEKTLDLTLRNGTRTINEVRSIRGQQPIGPEGDVPMIYTTTGAMTVDQVVNPPEPPPAPAPHAAVTANNNAPKEQEANVVKPLQQATTKKKPVK